MSKKRIEEAIEHEREIQKRKEREEEQQEKARKDHVAERRQASREIKQALDVIKEVEKTMKDPNRPLEPVETPTAPPAKKRRVSKKKAEGQASGAAGSAFRISKKSTSATTMANMASKLSGMSKPLDSTELGEDVLLAAPQKLPAGPPEASNASASTTGSSGQDTTRKTPASAVPNDVLWTRNHARYSNFIPACMEDAFTRENDRFIMVQNQMKEVMEFMNKEIRDTMEEYKATKPSTRKKMSLTIKKEKNGGGGSEEDTEGSAEITMYKRIKNLETFAASLQKRLSEQTARIDALAKVMAGLSDHHLALLGRHREFARHMICHLTKTFQFDPNTKGSNLLGDPFVYS